MSICVHCGACDSDLRGSTCFDCATAGERRALKRGVVGHLAKAVRNCLRGRWGNARIDLSWAYERATKTGDYSPGGYAERELA